MRFDLGVFGNISLIHTGKKEWRASLVMLLTL
jgi:hypothetical protein